MNNVDDPCEVLLVEEETEESGLLSRGPAALTQQLSSVPGVLTARFHGFDLEDRPLVTGLPGLAHEIIAARSGTPLSRGQIGSTVVVLCEQGDVHRPIIMGVVQEQRWLADSTQPSPKLVTVYTDDDRLVLSAEREIVLRCGEASITLTRAGKVLIKGAYVLSRSSGYNKIKGAAVEIN